MQGHMKIYSYHNIKAQQRSGKTEITKQKLERIILCTCLRLDGDHGHGHYIGYHYGDGHGSGHHADNY